MPSRLATLRASAVTFSTRPRRGDATAGQTGARVHRVLDDLDTTVILLESDGSRLAILASHLGTSIDDATLNLQNTLADALRIPVERTLIFSSHNHSVPLLETRSRTGYERRPQPADLTTLGRTYVRQLRSAASELPGRLEPVSVWYAQDHERRITYNRKGRRADGSTYFMREEDRAAIARDFTGDIDSHAPLVVLRRDDGSNLAAIVQFCGHPVTLFHPEHLIATGDWPQFAARRLARRLGGAPVAFLQGCAGDINSKHMFSGNIAKARRYGSLLAAAYMRASRKLKPSARPGMDYRARIAHVPLARLPAASVLQREIDEIEAFIRRAAAGDPHTLNCVGLNFPLAMSPAFRGKLVEYVLPWSQWALDVQRRGAQRSLPRHLDLAVHVLRLGDVAIVGMPTEPFMGIGRQIRDRSPLPLTIPCGYVNQATGFIGYVPDSPNVGDREYMSAFHRYTRYLPPFRRPAGDVLARTALAVLRDFSA
jgi:hypothetical protein